MEKMEIDGKVSKEFWSKKRVFLTGHTGFKGSWLSFILKSVKSRYCSCTIADLRQTESKKNVGKKIATNFSNHVKYIRN